MSDNAITINAIAGGNILPKTFVKLDLTGGSSFRVLQAGVGSVPIGISGNWTRFAPNTPADDGYEAIAGEQPEAVAVGGVTPVTAGAAFGTGVFLKPDAAGKAILATAADVVGAISLEAAAGAGESIRCLVLPPGSKAPV